ncbi:SLBB domain-containing protein [Roseateles oligotrophus]|uniref:SLBB domain-containing protein n=1 Tax=Roseateles oligotrophus TaxID=1769250 RepID=A0ABT2YFX4_9BURK|nr:SLBB domain-containing protein [Roseateles oligotrophus]MCV2368875.1 SLBB domain-containing protein [Roseateles oligotrophus]
MKTLLTAMLCLAACLLQACSSTQAPPDLNRSPPFKAVDKSVDFPTPESLAELEGPVDPVYRLGSGDILSMQVWGRPELTGRHVVGPDGVITLPLAGPAKVGLLTREEAALLAGRQLDRFYMAPQVQFTVEQYTSNRLTVLGRVANPGLLSFDKMPTLLEALAKAGSLPVIDKQATLTRCAIIRGRDKLIWVDLKRLLNGGDVRLNLRMKPGDLIYIPDSADTMVYVLGAVHRPGAYRLTPDMSVLDALATAGGPNEDAQPKQIGIYRPARKEVEVINLQTLIDGSRRVNYSLEEGDVIFVPKSGIAEFGYVTRQLSAGLSFLTLGLALGN